MERSCPAKTVGALFSGEMPQRSCLFWTLLLGPHSRFYWKCDLQSANDKKHSCSHPSVCLQAPVRSRDLPKPQMPSPLEGITPDSSQKGNERQRARTTGIKGFPSPPQGRHSSLQQYGSHPSEVTAPMQNGVPVNCPSAQWEAWLEPGGVCLHTSEHSN